MIPIIKKIQTQSWLKISSNSFTLTIVFQTAPNKRFLAQFPKGNYRRQHFTYTINLSLHLSHTKLHIEIITTCPKKISSMYHSSSTLTKSAATLYETLYTAGRRQSRANWKRGPSTPVREVRAIDSLARARVCTMHSPCSPANSHARALSDYLTTTCSREIFRTWLKQGRPSDILGSFIRSSDTCARLAREIFRCCEWALFS